MHSESVIAPSAVAIKDFSVSFSFMIHYDDARTRQLYTAIVLYLCATEKPGSCWVHYVIHWPEKVDIRILSAIAMSVPTAALSDTWCDTSKWTNCWLESPKQLQYANICHKVKIQFDACSNELHCIKYQRHQVIIGYL